MFCPHCRLDLKVPNRAFHNANSYSSVVRVTTECCFNVVEIIPVRSYTLRASGLAEDDWGVPIGIEGQAAYFRLDQQIGETVSKGVVK
jgi:hypothetical protein